MHNLIDLIKMARDRQLLAVVTSALRDCPLPAIQLCSMAIQILYNDNPERSLVLAAPSHVLAFRHSSARSTATSTSSSFASLVDREATRTGHQCTVEFADPSSCNLGDYSVLSGQACLGCLGLISIARDTFLCVITAAQLVAQVRPSEMVYRIRGVEFRMYWPSGHDLLCEYI